MKKYIVASAVLILAACGGNEDNNGNNHDNNDHNNEEFTVEDDACEHMIEGPEVAITAVAVGGDAPTVADTHTRYDITIDGGSGIVLVEIAEESEMHFFFSAGVDLTVTDASDAEIAAEETIATVAECDEVAEGAAYDLGVGTYTLTIETTETEVSMVPVPGGEHGHE